MSAPLVVNTTDGVVWKRRPVTRDGQPLYALADAPASCPEFVMATYAELVAHGIAGVADALPVPVSSVEDVSPQVAKLRNLLAGQRAAVEDPHDSPLHHDYRVPRDLPEPGGA